MTEEQFTVEYRDIPGFPGYRVGNDGSVWSRRKRVGRGPGKGTYALLTDVWKPMCLQTRPNGYIYVKLSGNQKVSIHRAVLEAFVGVAPVGYQACHSDGNRSNNRLSNLRWDSPAANQADRVRHGTDLRGEKVSTAKLTADQVRQMRAERTRYGTFFYVLAAKYGVTTAVAHSAITGKTWAHVI
jgi:hypothetical protein